MSEENGWAVCPICGAVIADIDGHVLYHETVVVDLVVDIAETIIAALTPEDDTDAQTTEETTEETT